MAHAEKIPFCPGPNRIDNGTWFLVQGTRPAECTFCEFCVENGCVDRDRVFKLPGPIKDCECVCRGKHIYATSFLCPLCLIFGEIKSFEKRNCCDCKKPAGNKYCCDVCSFKQKKCIECTDTVSSYDEYQNRLSIIINDIIAKYENPNYQMNNHVSMVLTEKDIDILMSFKRDDLKEYLMQRRKKVLDKHVGMNAQQIWQKIMAIKMQYQQK